MLLSSGKIVGVSVLLMGRPIRAFLLDFNSRRVGRGRCAHERLWRTVERITGPHAIRSRHASFDVFRGELKSNEFAPQLPRNGQRRCTAGERIDNEFAWICTHAD